MLMLLLIGGRTSLPQLSPLIRLCCQLLPAALIIYFPNQPLLVAVELRLSYLFPLDVDCCIVGNKSLSYAESVARTKKLRVVLPL